MTPDFTGRQGYLGAAPGGIDALYAHTRPGGRGAGVQIIDIELGWRFSHEDLLRNQGGVVGGVPSNDQDDVDHGTAVVGVMGGDVNTFGITGICPDANVRAISICVDSACTTWNPAGAITNAADMLSPGDIILIELHYPGPRFDFQWRKDQLGYIPVEWWEDEFQAIRYATMARGVIVVEAAGNGAENLDDPLYNTPKVGFPSSWTNPFNRANRDCGAVLVGAGAPPPGTHGFDHGPDRSRLDFSNFGASVDAQGWGAQVTTTGYGWLQGGPSQDEWYMDQFGGTSGASPIVAGALACLQGFRRATGGAVLTPAFARLRLRATGSPQQDAPGRPAGQRIGNRPNLRERIPPPPKPIEKRDPDKIKDFEEGKFGKNENKEVKDKLEIKETKPEKFEIELRDFDKVPDIIKGTDAFDWLGRFRDPGQQLGRLGGAIEERLARLEQAVGLPSPAVPAAQPAVCTAFGAMPVGLGPNPRPGNQASFRVFGSNGLPLPVTEIRVLNGIQGLDCGFRAEAYLPGPCQDVILALVHFGSPATIQALDNTGTVVATATVAPGAGSVQSISLAGSGIARVRLTAPADRALLARFCFRREGKIQKLEKAEKSEKTELKDPLKEKIEMLERGKELGKDSIKEKDYGKEGKDSLNEKDAYSETPPGGFGGSVGAGSVEERLASLEANVGELAHFIGAELRPDLTGGALSGEPDLGAGDLGSLSRQLAKDSADAKQAKDAKDVEKLREQ